MVNSSGYPLQPAITIPADAISVSISNDGVVSVVQPGNATATTVGTIQVATFINNGGLQSIGGNLYLETASSGSPTPNTPGLNGAGVLNQYYVETSNERCRGTGPMIQTQRAYELNSKVVSRRMPCSGV